MKDKGYTNVLEVTTWFDPKEWVIIPTIRIHHRELAIEWLCFALDFYLAKHED